MTFNFTVKEFILGNGTGTPTLQFYKRGFELNGNGESPSWQDIILSGNTALTLVNAKEDGLNYLKLFGGTELLPETYLDTVTLSGGTVQRNIPSEYTQVEYLSSNSEAYIDTGIAGGNDNLEIGIEFEYNTYVNYGGVFGNWVSDEHNTTRCIISDSQNRVYINHNNKANVPTSVNCTMSTKHNVIITHLEVVVDGTEISASSPSATGIANNSNISLFNRSITNPNTERNIGLKVYSWYVKDNGVLIQKLIPCRRNSDSVLGMYDTVTNTFLTNVGTGTFTAGADVTTPSPDYPKDIVCNNGTIKARMASGLPLGYQAVEYLETSGTQYIDIGVIANDTTGFDITFQKTVNNNTDAMIIGSRNGADGRFWIDVDHSSTLGELLVGWNTYFRTGFTDILNKIRIVENYNNNRKVYINDVENVVASQALESTLSAQNVPLYLFCANVSGTGASYFGSFKLFDAKITSGTSIVRNLIPCRRNSDNELGMYDLVSQTFLTNQGTGTFTAGSDVDGMEIYTDGTVEQVTDSLGNTASAEMLLSVSTYKDTQEVLNGSVTRNVGIKVLDGTEEWIKSGTYTGSFYADIEFGKLGGYLLCTHGFATSSIVEYASALIGAIYSSGESRFNYKYDDGTATVAQFTQWLADQYANGTPVIVVYPTSSATTETVTGQFLSKSPVTQTAGSIDNLPIAITESSHTTPTPSQPLDIVSNNGVLKVEHQSGLPIGYTKVDYIQSSGYQWLNTNVVLATPQSEVYIDCTFDSIANGKSIVGCQNSNASIIRQAWFMKSEGALYIYNSNAQNYTLIADNLVAGERHQIKVTADASNNITVNFDGTTTTDSQPSTSDNDNPLYLFDNKAGAPQRISAKIYSAYIKGNDGNLAFNGIPCKRESDNVLGMYDTVTGTFFTNQGTGTFVAGSETTDLIVIKTDGTVETVEVHGKNLFDKTTTPEQIYVTATVQRLGIKVAVKAGTYIASGGTSDRLYTKSQYNDFYGTAYTLSDGAVRKYTLPQDGYILFYTDTNTMPSLDTLQLEDGSTATTYEQYYNGGTATAEMLLAVGDYQDVQSVLDGGVTRNVGVKVFDGSEDWYLAGSTANLFNTPILDSNTSNEYIPYSTHFQGVLGSTAYGSMTNGEFKHSSNGNNWYFKNIDCSTADQFKQWLSDQYNAGFPVIVVYPLATATTESVTGQPLTTQAGTNIVEITQGSIDNLPLEVSYKATI